MPYKNTHYVRLAVQKYLLSINKIVYIFLSTKLKGIICFSSLWFSFPLFVKISKHFHMIMMHQLIGVDLWPWCAPSNSLVVAINCHKPPQLNKEIWYSLVWCWKLLCEWMWRLWCKKGLKIMTWKVSHMCQLNYVTFPMNLVQLHQWTLFSRNLMYIIKENHEIIQFIGTFFVILAYLA